jgi:AcrR family transcriptional regulator
LDMPRTSETNHRIRSEQRDRIIEAARRVFARKGLVATIDDVALEAGVSHGLAYRYFTNKSALFAELVSADLQAPTGWQDQFVEAPEGPMLKISQLVTGLVESRRANPQQHLLLARVLMDEDAPATLKEQVAQRGKKMRAILRAMIVDGQANGEVAQGDPDQLVRAIFASLEGLSAGPMAEAVDFPAAEIFLRMLKP